MKLLTALAGGLALYAVCSLLEASLNNRHPTQQFRCWLCKRPTTCPASAGTRHHDCGYCGIGNKLLPGAIVGQLPDIQVSLV